MEDPRGIPRGSSTQLTSCSRGVKPVTVCELVITVKVLLRHEALCYIPGSAGRNSEGGFWA